MTDTSVIQLTVPELRSMMYDVISKVLEPIQMQLTKIEGQQYTDVCRVDQICEIFHCSRSELAEIVRSGVLGRCLWKKAGGSNTRVTLVMPQGQRRFLALQQMMRNEREAFYRLGADEAERQWQSRNL